MKAFAVTEAARLLPYCSRDPCLKRYLFFLMSLTRLRLTANNRYSVASLLTTEAQPTHYVISTETNEVSEAEKSQCRDFSTAFAIAHSAQNDNKEIALPSRCRKATHHARLAALIAHRVAAKQLITG